MKPVRPDRTQPAMNASVRKRPDCANVKPAEPYVSRAPSLSTGFTTSVEVTNTTIASGIRITAIVLNWRRRYAIAPSWIAEAISIIVGRALVGREHAAHQEEPDRDREQRGAAPRR